MSEKTEEDIVEGMFNALIDDDSTPAKDDVPENTEIEVEGVESIAEDTTSELDDVEQEPAEVEQAEDNSENTVTEETHSDTPADPPPADPPIGKYKQRDGYGFAMKKRDLVFKPGTGGNFFARMIYDKVLNQFVGVFGYDERINEYAVSQSMAHQVISAQSRKNIANEINLIPQRLQFIVDYIQEIQYRRNTTEFDWFLEELRIVLDVAHRRHINPADLRSIQFSDFLISKTDGSFTIQDELEQLGLARVGEFYDNVHDLFYRHYHTHSIHYMTDLCHVPYHVSTFKSPQSEIWDYEYANIIAHDTIMYTDLLRKVKHMLRNEIIKDEHIKEVREYVEKYTRSPFELYRYVNREILTEQQDIGADREYSKPFFYRDMLIDINESRWHEFYEFFGYEEHFWRNKNKLLDTANEYHEKNIKLLQQFLTTREIDVLLNPYRTIRKLSQ